MSSKSPPELASMFFLRHRLAWLLIVCGVTYLTTASGHFISTDEEDLFQNAMLLWLEFSSVVGSSADGVAVSAQRAPQEPGFSLLAVPLVLGGEMLADMLPSHWHAYTVRAFATSLTLCVTLLTVLVIYRWVSELYDDGAALITAAMVGLASLAWPYSGTFYREPFVALCLLASFWLLDRFRRERKRPILLAAIALLLMASASKFTSALVLPWWLGMVPEFPAARQRQRWFILLTGTAALGLMFVLSYTAKELTVRHYLEEFRHDLFTRYMDFIQYGAYGLLFSTGKGLIVCVPPFLLSVWGWFYLRKHDRHLALMVGGVFLTYLVVYATRRGWHGGACWGPRYLVPVLSLIMLPIGSLIVTIQSIPGERKRSLLQLLVVGVFCTGVLVQLAATSIAPLHYYYTRYQEGIISAASFGGGPTYLQEIFFNPQYSPIIGHAALATNLLFRSQAPMTPESRTFPGTPEMLQEYFVESESIDYWWIHIMNLAALRPRSEE